MKHTQLLILLLVVRVTGLRVVLDLSVKAAFSCGAAASSQSPACVKHVTESDRGAVTVNAVHGLQSAPRGCWEILLFLHFPYRSGVLTSELR